MAFENGTVTDYHDLLDKLNIFLISAGWSEELYDVPGSITATARLIMRAPGNGADRRPFCMFRSFCDVATPYYTIEMMVASDYDSGLSYDAQLELSPPVFLSSSNASMEYWFYANSRRVIIVTQVGSSYVSAYSGMFMPFALPDEIERPFYVGANAYTVSMAATSNDTSNSNIGDPGQGAAYFLNQNLNWRVMGNREVAASSDFTAYVTDNGTAVVWPKKDAPNASYSTVFNGFAGNGFTQLRPNINGEMPMFQCHIIDPADNANYGALIGALDGVYAVPGFDRVTEQVITLDAQDYRIFQSSIRSSPNHFMAIMEI